MSAPDSTPASEPRVLGRAFNRVDGVAKITGTAKYAAEYSPPGVLYGFALSSTVSKAEIASIDIADAEQAPGVRLVLTHENAPKLKQSKPHQKTGGGIQNERRLPLSDATVSYGGQYIAFAVAESLAEARHAISLIRVQYKNVEAPALHPSQVRDTGEQPKSENGDEVQVKKGEVSPALNDDGLVVLERIYETPTETHNPMEPSATVAHWHGDEQLTLYDASQYVKGVQDIVAQAFGLKKDDVHVINPYVGGAFGCKGSVWPHVLLTAMAAKVVGAPVKFALSRPDMFTGTGHRTPTFQAIALAATRDGQLQAIRHRVETVTSPVGEFVEHCGARSSGVLYSSPAIEIEETIYKVNVGTPTFMRAPGECPGTYGVECAMDELAAELKCDPLQLRLRNYASEHPTKGKPFSTKFLREAYKLGAEKFRWSERTPEPRSMRNGRMLVGWGMATATYPGYMFMATAEITLTADGAAAVKCAAHDIGTGAYTALGQIAAEAIGLPFDRVTFELGDSAFPQGPVAGGSNTTATVGAAVYTAAAELHEKLAKLAVKDEASPLHGLSAKKITMTGPGELGVAGEAGPRDRFENILRRAGRTTLVAEGSFHPSLRESIAPKHAFHSFGAQFCEVQIDPELPFVHVTRFVSVMDCGRIINPKTARSQILGGIVMGIGMALEEETLYDPRTGVPTTRNLADYHVPVNADIPDIDVHFVGEPDLAFNPMGSRGLGEIGITGTAAAIANAVFHATGIRVRKLPITLDKLLG